MNQKDIEKIGLHVSIVHFLPYLPTIQEKYIFDFLSVVLLMTYYLSLLIFYSNLPKE